MHDAPGRVLLDINYKYFFQVRTINDEPTQCHLTRREIFSKFYQVITKSDCIYHFPIDLEPNGRSIGYKSMGNTL